jgi:hypothetical protein
VFEFLWTERAENDFRKLEKTANSVNEKKTTNKKSAQKKGLFKQIIKALKLLKENPRHPGLQTHAYHSLRYPWNEKDKVFEAYAQNKTSGAYRVFWCYGPKKNQITIIAITPHP